MTDTTETNRKEASCPYGSKTQHFLRNAIENGNIDMVKLMLLSCHHSNNLFLEINIAAKKNNVAILELIYLHLVINLNDSELRSEFTFAYEIGINNGHIEVINWFDTHPHLIPKLSTSCYELFLISAPYSTFELLFLKHKNVKISSDNLSLIFSNHKLSEEDTHNKLKLLIREYKNIKFDLNSIIRQNIDLNHETSDATRLSRLPRLIKTIIFVMEIEYQYHLLVMELCNDEFNLILYTISGRDDMTDISIKFVTLCLERGLLAYSETFNELCTEDSNLEIIKLLCGSYTRRVFVEQSNCLGIAIAENNINIATYLIKELKMIPESIHHTWIKSGAMHKLINNIDP
jgi:hypothetical protein